MQTADHHMILTTNQNPRSISPTPAPCISFPACPSNMLATQAVESSPSDTPDTNEGHNWKNPEPLPTIQGDFYWMINTLKAT